MSVVYKFLPFEATFQVLESKSLKVSTLGDLNDVFDCSPRFVGNAGESKLQTEKIAAKLRTTLLNSNGVICFSNSFVSPLLWAHYARSATGFALGFKSELLPSKGPGNEIVVRYEKDRPIISITPNPGMPKEEQIRQFQAFYGTKAVEWMYEEELRHVVLLERCNAAHGMYFMSFNPNALQTIITGCNNTISLHYLKRYLKQRFEDHEVNIQCSKPHPERYEIILEQPAW